jgi:predicted nucleotide-binding protein
MNEQAGVLVAKAENKLREFLDEDQGESGDFDSLSNFVVEAISLAFGESSKEVRRVSSAFDAPISMYHATTPAEYLECARDALRVIGSIKEIKSDLYSIDADLAAGMNRVAHASGRKVFVVHGHHDALKQTVARFLERAKLEPVILAEQPSGGATIIEKLEANSDVAYAVVLLTGDDLGGINADDLRPRARQNVVFELGYFVGLLARKRVCALVEEGVEIFSDISGVTYISVDEAGAWRAALAKELNAAGLEIDLAALL